LLSKISSTFRKLPSEVFKTSAIKVRIGKISVAEQNEHVSLESYSEFLRKKTYMLANPFEKKQITDDSSLKLPKAKRNSNPAI
jgi:hypothetical protein